MLCAISIITAGLVGCAPQATFEVTVVNQTKRPLTVGVVKDGPPYEFHLAGPDQWALESPMETLPRWGVLVPPGRTIDSPPITGGFPQGTLAYCRVYASEGPNTALLAISDPSPNRAEVLIYPGRNEVVVTDGPKGIVLTRARRGDAEPR